MFAQLADVVRQPDIVAIAGQTTTLERIKRGSLDFLLCGQDAQRITGRNAVVENNGGARSNAGGLRNGRQGLPDLLLLVVSIRTLPRRPWK